MRSLLSGACVLLLCAGCAFNRPDHFYALTAQPVTAPEPRAQFRRQVVLRVVIPSAVDRSELVLHSAAGMAILEHERWAAPLTDQMVNVLGQDIEARRPDALISLQRITQAGAPATVVIAVDVVQLAATRAQNVSLEARWRIEDVSSSKITLGRATFFAPVSSGDYSRIPQAISACIAQLADQLTAGLGNTDAEAPP